jgi:N,N'-diacetyllegionaminate synthase
LSNLFSIGEKKIEESSEPYIIAEVGINHGGNLNTALEMIEVAKSSGADAVKFQTFKAEEFCGDPEQQFTYISAGKKTTESMLAMFKRMELEVDDWSRIRKHAVDLGIEFFSTPQNFSDLQLLLPLGVRVIKVGSDDLTNLPLISSYSKEGLPLILSSGMADMSEVHKALKAAGWFEGKQVAILVCTSQYPTPTTDVNINRVSTLRAAFPNLIVGFSDHTQGNEAAIMATALGARIFEKHFTLNQESEGPDHWFSLNPTELHAWVKSIRDSHAMLGSGAIIPTEQELVMREVARRSVVALSDIAPNEILNNSNTGVRRPGTGLAPEFFSKLIGRRSNKLIQKGQTIEWEDLS